MPGDLAGSAAISACNWSKAACCLSSQPVASRPRLCCRHCWPSGEAPLLPAPSSALSRLPASSALPLVILSSRACSSPSAFAPAAVPASSEASAPAATEPADSSCACTADGYVHSVVAMLWLLLLLLLSEEPLDMLCPPAPLLSLRLLSLASCCELSCTALQWPAGAAGCSACACS